MTDRDRLIELLDGADLFLRNRATPTDAPLNEYDMEIMRNIAKTCDEAAIVLEKAIIPPCKVGDYIWLVFTPKYPANPNDYGKWFMKQDGVQRIMFGAKGLSIETWNMGTISAKEFGEKIFLTKEEAEQKLKEREG